MKRESVFLVDDVSVCASLYYNCYSGDKIYRAINNHVKVFMYAQKHRFLLLNKNREDLISFYEIIVNEVHSKNADKKKDGDYQTHIRKL